MHHINNTQKEKALSMIMNLDEKLDGVDLPVIMFTFFLMLFLANFNVFDIFLIYLEVLGSVYLLSVIISSFRLLYRNISSTAKLKVFF